MEYSKIISVTGLGGLFELVGSKNDGAIVRSLEDKTTKFVSSRVHSFSHLESIEVFTIRDNVNLVDVLNAMTASSEALPNANDAAAVKAYFQKVYPDMDFERVYASDMKKIVKWFTVLKNNDIEIKLREADEETEETAEEVETETEQAEAAAPKVKAEKPKEAAEAVAVAEEEAPAAKKKAKASAKKEEEATTEVAADEAPKKKTAKKKKTEE
ncbi:DUF5606 family protein [Foetidibacter luteolus]|uniref:DUF5606 family protein n=1 Tax=Foetidibacter luteolus TaxID=2608880 RepID=UPI00129B76D5|nr:DUF5606 domain-containing protein [Foetidibacter luteolus]